MRAVAAGFKREYVEDSLPYRSHAGTGLGLGAEGFQHLGCGRGHDIEAGQLQQHLEHLRAEVYAGKFREMGELLLHCSDVRRNRALGVRGGRRYTGVAV